MKKRICILLLAAVLLMLIPHAASANAPVRRPRMMMVDCENVAAGTRIDVVLYRDNGFSRRVEGAYRPNQEPGIVFEAEDGETSFCLICIYETGAETETTPVQLVDYGLYRYDGAANSLTSNGTYYDGAQNCNSDFMLTCLLFPTLLLLLILSALALTLLVEWLTALCFGVRPVRYVFAINAITNPIMNILLLITFSFDRIGYWITLVVLELAVVFIEYAFYRKKYPAISRRRLLLFSTAANVSSLVLGGLLQYFIL